MNTIWKRTKHILSWLLILILVLMALMWLAGLSTKSKLAKQNPPRGEMIDMGGFKMHLYCAGEGGPAVILEAGLNDFYVYWAKVQPEVAKTTRVCSYDRAGLGWSEASPNPRASDVMAEELRALLQNAGVESPYILVGHSFGGINVRQFAQKYPDEVAGIVLVDSAHEQQGARLPFLQHAAEQFVNQFRTLSFISSLGLMALSPETIPNRGLPQDAYRQYQAVLATTKYFDGAIAESSFFYSSMPEAPKSLGDLPLIVLTHGLPDLSLGLTESDQERFEQEWVKMQTELLGLSSNRKQIIAEASGHYIQLDQPELIIESVLELIQRHQK